MRKLLLVICFTCSTSALALNPSVKSPDEIIGCWERIDFTEETQKKINAIEPWPVRYQWFCFESDGTLNTYGSTKRSKQTSTSLRKLFEILPKGIRYTIPHKGIIKTEQNIPGSTSKQTIIWGANFRGDTVLFDGKTLEKGMLIMSIFDKSKEKNVYYRYLRRVND